MFHKNEVMKIIYRVFMLSVSATMFIGFTIGGLQEGSVVVIAVCSFLTLVAILLFGLLLNKVHSRSDKFAVSIGGMAKVKDGTNALIVEGKFPTSMNTVLDDRGLPMPMKIPKMPSVKKPRRD